MNRREFLVKNVAALASAGFLANWGTTAEIREYKVKDKPLLTENNLNRLFAAAAQKHELEGLSRQATANLPLFLESQFSLSPNQRKTIAGHTRENVAALNHLLESSIRTQTAPEFRFLGPLGAGKESSTEVTVRASAATQKLVL